MAIKMDEVRMVQKTAKDAGLPVELCAEKDVLVINLGEPVQYIGLKLEDIIALVGGLKQSAVHMMMLQVTAGFGADGPDRAVDKTLN